MSDDQPRPRYGEYAPGHVPGQTPSGAGSESAGASHAAATPHPSAAPQGSVPPPAIPAPAPWSGTDSLGYQPPVKKRNTVDVVFTVILLVLGLFGTLAACGYAALFNDPQLLDEALRSQGRNGFSGQVGSAPIILIASHVVLYLIAVGLSILSLVKKRITFWIPLVIGVVAAVIFWVTVVSVLLSDPSFSSGSGL